ncbi:DUF6214 family protein [Streptomyces sp. NBC_00199]|uniref:DUF6214 family protein n=1 Tax=Streptomyces sp. NBC_00199 TaxID=2975678 RepID=UPI0022567E97|nr:DUF6214 family protein [Streptomyces sp. NBC_00199]MCX5264170.1 DUF6214 family protein [Streptomyces sp. NBC_00199]
MSVWPAWEVQEAGGATSWFHVRLSFAGGARVDLLAVVSGGRVSIEDIRARPALSLVDLTLLADWIEGPLFDGPDEDDGEPVSDAAPSMDCMDGMDGMDVLDGLEAQDRVGTVEGADHPTEAGRCAEELFGLRRARPVWPRGLEGRWLAAQEYRAAQEEGADPVLAVMCATGHSRRRSLRLIARARDAGYLTPRHARR